MNATEGPQATLVLCVGNEMRGDDSAGPAVARLLGPRLDGIARIEVSWGEGTELMRAWEGCAHVVVVDAAKSGAEPGTLHVFDAGDRKPPKDFFCYSTHRFGLAEAIELSEQLGILPDRLTVYAIEGVNFGLGDEMHENVKLAVQRTAERIAVEFDPGRTDPF